MIQICVQRKKIKDNVLRQYKNRVKVNNNMVLCDTYGTENFLFLNNSAKCIKHCNGVFITSQSEVT